MATVVIPQALRLARVSRRKREDEPREHDYGSERHGGADLLVAAHAFESKGRSACHRKAGDGLQRLGAQAGDKADSASPEPVRGRSREAIAQRDVRPDPAVGSDPPTA